MLTGTSERAFPSPTFSTISSVKKYVRIINAPPTLIPAATLQVFHVFVSTTRSLVYSKIVKGNKVYRDAVNLYYFPTGIAVIEIYA